MRAAALRGLGRPAEAAAALDAALAQNPTAALFRLRGQIHQDQGQPAAALACFTKAVERAPADHQANYLLAQAYAAAGRTDDAARIFAKVDELRKDLDQITELSRAAMKQPWDAAVRLKLATLCDHLDKPALAAMWRKAAAATTAPAAK